MNTWTRSPSWRARPRRAPGDGDGLDVVLLAQVHHQPLRLVGGVTRVARRPEGLGRAVGGPRRRVLRFVLPAHVRDPRGAQAAARRDRRGGWLAQRDVARTSVLDIAVWLATGGDDQAVGLCVLEAQATGGEQRAAGEAGGSLTEAAHTPSLPPPPQ